ncbi:hypothetical protein O6H91_07G103100 [Diphasiastrum complanatum]|uniref:Uncharacterized protein n=2 Tax=Diphasiastrum complanatum TaxID=34168 RepID=A0ACC2D8C9_DIPCM|nr:hypothetical protein O6H91_07G103100 [Diphasiastrum complanatum]KAJ7550473.1 hypothetical protein O6H91_07G103100 [Diphasiastrum complanatum]
MSFSPIISPKRCRTPARVESGDGETSSQRSVRRHLTLDSSPGRSAERLKPEFIVLLPNGLSLEIKDIRESHLDITVQKLIELVRNRESEELRKNSAVLSKRRAIEWGSRTWLEDEMGNNISDGELFLPNTSYPRKLILQDGVEDSHHFLEELWNITPEPHMLSGLPQDYTLETALADELDNSLQAVWASLDLRLISVDLEPGKITIFDTGEGMDSSPERSIRRWGTLGASSNRLHKQEAVGGKPPFLKPHFGVYGLGGVAAALHLGGCVCVSSKTKYSNKVVSLILEKRRLVEKHETGSIWKAPGELREMTDDEKKKSPNGSFTKVEITQLRKKHFCEKTGQYWEIDRLQRMLKDIYFPYIQVDIEDRFNKTDTPVHFEVNGLDLTEVEGGEVATTLIHSGPGKPFVIDVRVSRDKSKEREKDRGKPMMCEEANCRITCHYFPVKQGEESIAAILDKLNQQGGGLKEDFESFSRVSVRRLGRLLPDARWAAFHGFQKKQSKFL